MTAVWDGPCRTALSQVLEVALGGIVRLLFFLPVFLTAGEESWVNKISVKEGCGGCWHKCLLRSSRCVPGLVVDGGCAGVPVYEVTVRPSGDVECVWCECQSLHGCTRVSEGGVAVSSSLALCAFACGFGCDCVVLCCGRWVLCGSSLGAQLVLTFVLPSCTRGWGGWSRLRLETQCCFKLPRLVCCFRRSPRHWYFCNACTGCPDARPTVQGHQENENPEPLTMVCCAPQAVIAMSALPLRPCSLCPLACLSLDVHQGGCASSANGAVYVLRYEPTGSMKTSTTSPSSIALSAGDGTRPSVSSKLRTGSMSHLQVTATSSAPSERDRRAVGGRSMSTRVLPVPSGSPASPSSPTGRASIGGVDMVSIAAAKRSASMMVARMSAQTRDSPRHDRHDRKAGGGVGPLDFTDFEMGAIIGRGGYALVKVALHVPTSRCASPYLVNLAF